MSFLAEKKAPAACARKTKTFIQNFIFWQKKAPAACARPKKNVFFKNVIFGQKKAPAACPRPKKQFKKQKKKAPAAWSHTIFFSKILIYFCNCMDK